MNNYKTLIEVLKHHASTQSNALLYRYIQDETTPPITLSFSQVNEEAKAIASTLLKTCKKGDRALMLYPAGLEFITAFLGCLYAGVIAVPAYPPRKNQKLSRLKSIVADADASIIMTVYKSAIVGQPLFEKEETLSNLPWFITDIETLDTPHNIDVEVMPDDIAFLQYTSGSTGEPKGVMVTHKNIMSNMEYIYQSFGFTKIDKVVSWLPHFHDMGLIGGVLQPLYAGISVTLMAPAYFLQKPIRWLEVISKYKGTVSGGPNFAFDLCVDNIKDEELNTLDLSSWRLAFNGAEPVHVSTLDRYTNKFKECGFKHSTHYPCYGMAETTLIIAGSNSNQTAKNLSVNKKQLQKGKILKDTDENTSQAMVSSGFSWLDHEMILVDPKSLEEVQNSEVGEVWVCGDSVAKGYWKNPEKTKETFAAYTKGGKGPYLRTGDLAFYFEDELFICGREKDLLIIRGRNFYPQDIESVAALSSESLSLIGTAAFSVQVGSEEQLVIAQEVKRTELRKFNKEEVFTEIKNKVFEAFELKVYDIVLLKPGHLLKTSSGKVQRNNNKNSYENSLYQEICSLRNTSVSHEKEESTEVLEAFSYERFKTLSQDKKTLYVYQLIRYDVAALLEVSVSSISADDSLLSIGLDSLDMMRFLASLQKRYLFKIDIDVLFELSNLGELVHLIVQNLEKNLDVEESTVLHFELVQNDKNRYEKFELNEIQQAYALGRSKDVVLGNTACFVYAEFVSEKLDIVRLEEAWNKVIARHDMLRCVIDEQMNQNVLEEVPRFKINLDTSKRNILEKRETKLSTTLNPSVWPLFSLDVSILENNKIQTSLYIDMLICDASSIYILLDDLNHYYNEKKPLPSLEVTYKDYLTYEQKAKETNKHEKSINYWNNRITNLPMGPSLPLAVLASSIEKPHFTRRTFEIESSKWNLLQKKANDLHVTPTVLLVSLFSKVLAFWSNESRFCLNLTLFKRDNVHADVEKLVGDFTSLIPLEVNISKGKSLKLLFKEVQKQLLSDLTHSDVSGVEIIRQMRSHGIEGSMPIVFTSLLGLDDKLESCLGKTKFTLSQTPQVWIDNQVSQENGKLIINWDCLDELLNENLVNDMFEAYENLIYAFIEDKYEDMCLLPSKQVVAREKYNDTRKEVDKTLLPQSFMNAAFIHSDALALVDSASRLTYQQTHNIAVKIASFIQEQYLEKNEHVAILLPKGVEQVLAVLGCGYAGIPYLPLSIDLPKERILYLLKEANVTCVLSDKSLLESYEVEGTEVSDLTSYDTGMLHFEVQAKADDLAYTIFTSGSTGKPKGVMTTHKSVANTVHDMNERFKITSQDKLFGISALNFDLSVFDIYGALSVGATLVVSNEDERKDSAAWLRWIEDEKITVWNSVPALVDLLGDEGRIPSSLRLFLMSGDFISVDLVKKINSLSKAEIISLGGATEAAIWSIYYPITHTNMHKIPYGYPLVNQEIHVLDEDLNVCADFVHGDIYIKGLGLALGYLNDEEKTDSSFIKQGNEIFYKTGDIGYFSEEGYVQIIGRSDDQVKIQGYRVELGEIEEELLQMQEVLHGVVLVKEDHNKYKTLVAFLVSDEDLSLAAVKEKLSKNLPEYMIPSAIKTLKEIPLTANGKIDKKALLKLELDLVKRDFVKASGELQEYLRNSFCEVLKLNDVGVFDNFFELGGNSLSATRLVSKIRADLEIDLAIKELFLNPDIASLSEVIENNCKKVEVTTIQRLENREKPALSFAQERLWFLEQYENDNTIYQMPGLLSLRGSLDIDALEKALVSVVDRHEILRTNFIVENESVYQKIQGTDSFKLNILESSIKEMHAGVQKSLNTTFDLSSDSLFRVDLYKTSKDENYLCINMHHIISDGWSLAVIVKEFVVLYTAFTQGKENPLPELSIQYADFSAWQNEQLSEDVLSEKLVFWKKELEGIATLELPSSYPRPSVQSYKGKTQKFEIDENLAQKLQALSKDNDTTLYMTLLSAFSVLLHRYAGQDDIAIATPIAGRNHAQLEDLIGFFVNTLVLRHDYSEEPNFEALLSQVKQKSLDAFEHQDVPFEKIVESLEIDRDSAYMPLVQVLFVLQNNEKALFDLPNLSINLEELDNGTAKFDLALSMQEDEGRLSAYIQYASDLFSESYISEMIQSFQTLLYAIVENPQESVSHYPLLNEKSEREQLMQFNESSFTYDENLLIHKLFENKAEEIPETIAVVYEDKSLTYKQLNDKANQLATYLVQSGLKESTLVALCLERSLDMIVSIVAVLKSSCAYVPIDPLYPKDRIEYIFADTNAQVLITQETIESKMPYVKQTILIDTLNLDSFNSENLNLNTNSKDLAYVIYTSGSTGRPKGVMIEHKALVNSTLARESVYVQGKKNTTLLIPSYAFDASVAAIWESLVFEGSLVILSTQDQNDIFAIADKIQKHKVTRTLCVSTVYQALLQASECIDRLQSLECVSVGGESVDKLLIELSFEHLPKVRLFNEYGPTEATVWSSFCEITRGCIKDEYYEHGIIPIGKPINNAKLYILDKQLQLVPKGVSAELHIAGDGLARAYLNQSELSDEKFIANPFEENTKMYKTGDLVRYLDDGNIQFLGRIDEQVKVRGFRIELGEIESLVNQISGIKSSLAFVPKDQNSSIHLFCEKDSGNESETDEVNHEVTDMWENIFDAKYEEMLEDDEDEFNITGWKSSYTGEDIPNDQMQRWVQATADLVKSTKAKNVFEIGCGSGLILYKIHEDIQHYHGIDISKNTILKLEKALEKREITNISLDCATADNFEIPKGIEIDTVLINSVVQYFPNAHYLDEVIEKSINALTSKTGKIIIGDVLNLRLQEAFYYSLIQYSATKVFGTHELIEMIDMKKISEEELFVDPSYFVLLKDKFKGIKDIKIHLKHELDDNEMNNFRFDVILDIDKDIENNNALDINTFHYEFALGDEASSVMNYINKVDEGVVKISNIPNKKLIQEKSLADLRQDRTEVREDALYVNDMYILLHQLDFDFEISPSENNKYFDVLINKTDKEISFYTYQELSKHSHKLTNNSSLSNMFLIEDIKEKLELYLPEYMIPSRIKMIDAFPLTPNGKIDKKALIKLEAVSERTQEYVAPRNENETILVKAFEKVLNVDKVGIYHNFFELGGNSILTVQLVTLVKDSGIHMDVKDIFQAQCVAELNEYLRSNKEGELINLDEEAILEDNIQILDTEYKVFENSDILLTGVTGFVGRYLLRKILEDTKHEVYCLVRASSKEEGFERIKRSLSEYNLWEESFSQRIYVVLGDLAKENLGIDSTEYDTLSQKISMVYHCATYMNHLASYEFLKTVNVEGVKEILRFAMTFRDKKIEYVSTIGVFNEFGDNNFTEESSLYEQKHYKSSGYAGSKYVAEQICILAQQRGFDLNIYRLGLITGDKIIGKNDETQWFQQLLEAGMKLSCMFNVEGFDMPIAPVDFVADSIVSLANSKYKAKIYHLSNSHFYTLDELTHMYNTKENSLEKVSLNAFTQKLKVYNEKGETLKISNFFTKYFDFNDESFEALAFEAAKPRNKILMDETLKTLKTVGINFPDIDEKLIRKYFNSSVDPLNIIENIQIQEHVAV